MRKRKPYQKLIRHGFFFLYRFFLYCGITGMPFLQISFSLSGHSEPVCINPATVGLLSWLVCHEAYLGSYPLAFAHGELGATLGVLLAVETVREMHLAIVHAHTHIDVDMCAWLIVYLVYCRWLECGDKLLRLRFALVGALA